MNSKAAAKQADTVPAVTPQALEGRSKEELEQLGKRAQKFLKKNPRVAKAFYSMIASVRVYNTALVAINDECLNAKMGEDSAAVAFILSNSVKQITAKEFERGELQKQIQQHMLEFMAMELSLEQQRDANVAQESNNTQEVVRRCQPIKTAYALRRCRSDEDPCDITERERTVLLVGPRDLLQQIADVAILAKEYKQTTVRLLDTMKQHTDVSRKGNTNQWYFELGAQRWLNFATGRRGVTELLGKVRHALRGNRMDLLVVDDVSQAVDATSSLPVHIRVGSAQKTLRAYADGAGAAMLCCLPMDDADPNDKAWDKLEVYTELRFVGTDANDEITITTRGGDSWFAIPRPDKDLSDESREADEQHSSGLPLQGEAGRSGDAATADPAEEHEEAGND